MCPGGAIRRVLPTLALASALLLGGVNAQQVQIDWGTALTNHKLIKSDGSPLSISEFTIEIGGFSGGFVPTSTNYNQWLANWMIFDAITDPDSDTNGPGGTSADVFVSGGGTDARFLGTAHLLADQTSDSEDANGTDVFTAGLQAWVFIRNSDTISATTEWLLYTSTGPDSWEFPDVAGSPPGSSESWLLAQADSVKWGSILEKIVGEGEFTDKSSDFSLRTHRFPVIPEPGSMSLVLLGAIFLLRRQRP